MSRNLGVVVLAVMILAIGATTPFAQDERVVPLHQEPRQRMVFESGTTRILHVQMHPGDMSLFHTHAEPILYITFGESAQTRIQNHGGQWGAPNNVFPTSPPHVRRATRATSSSRSPIALKTSGSIS